MSQEIAELLDTVEGMLENYENASPPMDRSKFAGDLIRTIWEFGVATMGKVEEAPK